MPSTSGVKAGNAFVVIRALDQTSTGLQTVERKLIQFGQNVTNLGVGLAGRGVALLAPITYAANQFIKYEDAMKKVEAKSPGTAEDMLEIRKQARELGLTTALTADQVGQLQHVLAQKGYNRKEIQAMTKGIVDLARASGDGNDLMNDGIQAATGVSGVLRAYQMEASKATRIADLFAAAVDGSNMSLEEMIIAMSYAAPTGAEFNIPIEEVMAITSAMRDLNIDASIAGTAFRNMVLYMSEVKETDKFNKTLQDLTGNTIEFTDAAGNLRSPLQLLIAIQEATAGMGTAQRSNLLSEMFGTRATVPAGAVGRASKTVARLLSMFEMADGLSATRAAKTESGLGGAWRLFRASINEVSVAVGEAVSGPLNKLSKWVRMSLADLSAWIKENEDWVVSIVFATAAVTAFGLGLVGLGITVKTLSIGFGLLIILTKTLGIAVNLVSASFALLGTIATLSMAAIHSTWALPLIALAALVGVIIWATDAWGELEKTYGNGISRIISEFKEMGPTIADTFKMIVTALGDGEFELAFKAMMAGLNLLWVQVWNSMSKTVEDMFIETVRSLNTVLNSLMTMLEDAINKLNRVVAMHFRVLGKAWKAAGYTGIAKTFFETASALKNMKVFGEEIDIDQPLDDMAKESEEKRKKSLQDAKDDLAAVGEEIKKKREERKKQAIVEGGEEANSDDWRLRERAARLIKQGVQGPQISPKALEATNSKSVEAMKEFQENRNNASEGIAAQMLLQMKTQTELLMSIDEEIQGHNNSLKDVLGAV